MSVQKPLTRLMQLDRPPRKYAKWICRLKGHDWHYFEGESHTSVRGIRRQCLRCKIREAYHLFGYWFRMDKG